MNKFQFYSYKHDTITNILTQFFGFREPNIAFISLVFVSLLHKSVYEDPYKCGDNKTKMQLK